MHKRKLPTSPGWYFSVANFEAKGYRYPEQVDTWALDEAGNWWINGHRPVIPVPEDLWPVRMVQRG